MQNLRRSLQSKNSSGGLSQNRAPATLAPPRKVIKALYDYNTSQTEELSFSKGDFFHVVGNEDDEDWYEAYNPVTGARGYVPVTYFQILEKNQRNSSQSLEDVGNDSGSFTDPSPSHHDSQQQQQQQQQQQHRQPSNGSVATSPVMSQQKPKCQPLYGIVLYDFGAERPDELDAKVGDAILVIAQSNEEWYVAKHIGRLGGPGLIPVSFVEIRNMATGKPINVQEFLRETGTVIPRVEEWKKQAMDYKANSIPLGRIEAGEAAQQQQQQQQQQQLHHQSFHQQQSHGMHPQQFLQQQQPQQANQSNGPTIQQLKNKMSKDFKSQQRDSAPLRHPSQEFDASRRMTGRDDAASVRSTGTASSRNNGDQYDYGKHPDLDNPTLIVNASVESYHHADDQYWFSVRVEFASGAIRTLYRLYEDFYDFHIALLEEFPVESGRTGDQMRILPFMPIPLQVVTDTVTASRREDLDGYVQDLYKLPPRITQHPLVEQLFALRDGDAETLRSGAGGQRSSSPSVGRSTPSGSMFHSPSPSADRRPSVGPRAVFAAKSQPGPGNYRGHPDDPPSGSASPNLRSQPIFPIPGTSNGTEEMIKVKISYQEDIMAMRIPVAISFRNLQQKIFERLDTEEKELSYRDERGDFATIRDDADVREAMDRSGGKLMVYVD
ncbi:bud emergence protein 1 [Mortierella polycephala]|uniref:Bud emergence protein 1 n=1 Tax=Mortierella polycephala TaxID=41804 RepID=A0A9P6QB59_9FUNG|nr:bud emergence protein 1 [Mortierella polycephala]